MKVLSLIQLPPPVHGASKMNELAWETILGEFPDSKVIDIGLAKEAADVNRLSFLKGLKFVALLGKVWKETILYKPNAIYASISPGGLAFFKDFLFLLISKFLKVPLILHIHGNGISSYYGKRLFRFSYNYLFREESLIVLSPLLKKEYDLLEVNCRFFIVPNFNSFVLKQVDSCQQESLDTSEKNKHNILFFSNLRKGKGLFDFYNAVRPLLISRSDIIVTIAGPWSSDEDRIELFDLIKADENCHNGMFRSRIRIIGPIHNDEEKASLYKDADLFLFPSRIDTFPLVVLEAMELGVPVISTNQGAIPDMLSGKAGITVDIGDIASMTDNIERLIENMDEREVLISTAKEKVREHYSKRHFKKSLMKAFKEGK